MKPQYTFMHTRYRNGVPEHRAENRFVLGNEWPQFGMNVATFFIRREKRERSAKSPIAGWPTRDVYYLMTPDGTWKPLQGEDIGYGMYREHDGTIWDLLHPYIDLEDLRKSRRDSIPTTAS